MEGFSIFFPILPNNIANKGGGVKKFTAKEGHHLPPWYRTKDILFFHVLDIHGGTPPLLASWCANGAGGVLATTMHYNALHWKHWDSWFWISEELDIFKNEYSKNIISTKLIRCTASSAVHAHIMKLTWHYVWDITNDEGSFQTTNKSPYVKIFTHIAQHHQYGFSLGEDGDRPLIGRMGAGCNMIIRPTSTCANLIIPSCPSSRWPEIHFHSGHNWKGNMLIYHCSFMVSLRVLSQFAWNMFPKLSHLEKEQCCVFSR